MKSEHMFIQHLIYSNNQYRIYERMIAYMLYKSKNYMIADIITSPPFSKVQDKLLVTFF